MLKQSWTTELAYLRSIVSETFGQTILHCLVLYWIGMTNNRLRSIVPMFGGGTQYVETMEAILEFVESHQPTTDELIGWHRGTFANVESRDSILRRISYLEQVGFVSEESDQWTLGDAGREYVQNQETETLLRIMCDRNVGIRSLLYALTAGPMTIQEISDQQLDTHPDLGWSRGETDMAKQRANWLRSMGLVQKQGQEYELTPLGLDFVDDAIEQWAGADFDFDTTQMDGTADIYETVVEARVVDPEFRATVLSRHELTCPISGVDHPGLLDVAHVLSWSEYPDYRADLSNVLPLSKTHHAAFDRDLFTIDHEYRIQVNPAFDTESDMLRRTITNRDGDQISNLQNVVDREYLRQHNSSLDWVRS